MTTPLQQSVRRSMVIGLLAAAAGASSCFIMAGGEATWLWRSYYLGVMLIWPVAVAGTGLLALGNLTGGRWATVARPFYLACARTLPFVALLLLPLAFALPQIFPWAQPGNEVTHAFSPSKATWLSPQFFLGRSAGYIVVWLLLGFWLTRVSRLEVPPGRTFRMRRAGALSLVVLVPVTTFAGFDWCMTLEPLWYSSIYGAILIAGGVVVAHSLAIFGLMRVPLSTRLALLESNDSPEHHEDSIIELYNDLGNLLLAFVMLLTYFAFSQFFIIWSANLPSEAVWYTLRLSGGWGWMALAIVFCCFVIPFGNLLSRDVKRNIRRLAMVGAGLVAAHCLHLYWNLVPALPPNTAAMHVAYATAMIGILGLWLAVYWWMVGRVRVPQDFGSLDTH